MSEELNPCLMLVGRSEMSLGALGISLGGRVKLRGAFGALGASLGVPRGALGIPGEAMGAAP